LYFVNLVKYYSILEIRYKHQANKNSTNKENSARIFQIKFECKRCFWKPSNVFQGLLGLSESFKTWGRGGAGGCSPTRENAAPLVKIGISKKGGKN
jgi:hypothetical protein